MQSFKRGLLLVAVLSLSASERKLVTSSGKEFVAKAFYPEFRWDTVPLYQMFSDDHRLLSDHEVKKIAASSAFICIEKNHGVRTLGAAEWGAKHETARFRQVNPRVKSLCYFNSAFAYTFNRYSRRFAHGKVSNDDMGLLIRDPKTGKLAKRGKLYCFDVLNPDLRTWWSDTVGGLVRDSGTDGVFVDQMHGCVWLRKHRGRAVAKAQAEMMRLTKKAIGEDKILLLNNGAHIPALLQIGDAFMFEHYNPKVTTKKEAIVKDWAAMKRVAELGKISVYRFGADVRGTPLEKASRGARIEDKGKTFEQLSKQQLEFYLACYLIGAQPYSYFQYGWGWSLTTGPLTEYAQFQKPLGPPLDAYKRQSPRSWVFTREFTHASVWLDLTRREARITWKEEEVKEER